MQEYTVKWEIQVSAENHQEAAEEALDAINGTARVFDVIGENDSRTVDLTEGTETELRTPTSQFPNGFDIWQETHFDIVRYLLENEDNQGSMAYKTREAIGVGGVYDLAKILTQDFEEKHKGIVWGEEFEYYDTLEAFLLQEEAVFML